MIRSRYAIKMLLKDFSPTKRSQVIPAPLQASIIRPNASYIITGGTGGLGRSMTRWLAKKGAKNIILISRSGLAKESVHKVIQDLKEDGVRVTVLSCDVSLDSEVQAVIKDVTCTMPPIRGIIHGAMVNKVSLA